MAPGALPTQTRGRAPVFAVGEIHVALTTAMGRAADGLGLSGLRRFSNARRLDCIRGRLRRRRRSVSLWLHLVRKSRRRWGGGEEGYARLGLGRGR